MLIRESVRKIHVPGWVVVAFLSASIGHSVNGSEMVSEGWQKVGVLSQAAAAVAAVVALKFLWKYTTATLAVRNAAIKQADAAAEQVEKSLMPYVTLEFENDEMIDAISSDAWAAITQSAPPPAVHLKNNRVRFVNIGRGPAIEVSYAFWESGDRTAHTFPHLAAGESFEPPIPLGENGGEVRLMIAYKSLSGRRYLSEIDLEGGPSQRFASRIQVGEAKP